MPAGVHAHEAKGGQPFTKTLWINVKSSWDNESAGLAQTCGVHASLTVIKPDGDISNTKIF